MWVISGALGVALLGGCANESAERAAAAVASEFLGAVRSGDARAACALLVPRTEQELAVSEGQPCVESLPIDRLSGQTVREVAVWSDQAQVITDGDTMFLTEFETGWLIVAAGCQPRGEEPYQCVVGA